MPVNQTRSGWREWSSSWRIFSWTPPAGLVNYSNVIIINNLDSRTVLIIAWKFKAQTQCEFSKEEFLTGMVELGET